MFDRASLPCVPARAFEQAVCTHLPSALPSLNGRARIHRTRPRMTRELASTRLRFAASKGLWRVRAPPVPVSAGPPISCWRSHITWPYGRLGANPAPAGVKLVHTSNRAKPTPPRSWLARRIARLVVSLFAPVAELVGDDGEQRDGVSGAFLLEREHIVGDLHDAVAAAVAGRRPVAAGADPVEGICPAARRRREQDEQGVFAAAFERLVRGAVKDVQRVTASALGVRFVFGGFLALEQAGGVVVFGGVASAGRFFAGAVREGVLA